MAQLVTVPAVERELDEALAELRRIQKQGNTNTLATSALEYRIGALRRRRDQLQ